mmetsp:Transcript_65264/g.128757  ORF Transcript_65264/g.128757 Transcript_65264/m.128757 type:complete len:81 (-) Transcript_65264:154-396(-)
MLRCRLGNVQLRLNLLLRLSCRGSPWCNLNLQLLQQLLLNRMLNPGSFEAVIGIATESEYTCDIMRTSRTRRCNHEDEPW